VFLVTTILDREPVLQ